VKQLGVLRRLETLKKIVDPLQPPGTISCTSSPRYCHYIEAARGGGGNFDGDLS